MLIDCDTCTARHVACDDCVISVLLATPPVRAARPPRRPVTAAPGPASSVELDDGSREAIETLAAAGLVPPLRLVRPVPEPGAGREIA
ncbi:hypothetical protein [Jatrophihabitans fulvus]